MKKAIILTSALSLLLITSLMQGCKNNSDDSDDNMNANPEFVADNNTFAGYESWYLHDTKTGVDPANLGMAHGGADSTSERKIYFTSSSVTKQNGEFPVGTIVSKKTTWDNGNMTMITAMAKRGNNFDADGNDWEYFILNADGSILVDGGETKRGANLNNGGCKSCHGKVSNNDYIFTKQ